MDKGHLTRFQATKLVNDLISLPDAGALAGTAKKRSDPDELTLVPDDDDLTKVRNQSAQAKSPPAKKPAVPVNQELEALTAIHEDLFDDMQASEKRAEKLAAERQAAEKLAAERQAAAKAAAEKAAADKRAAEKAAADKRAADKAAAEKAAADKAAAEMRATAGRSAAPAQGPATQHKKDKQDKRRPEKTAQRQEPGTSQPPAPPPPQPPVEPVVVRGAAVMDDLVADMEASSALAPGGRESRGAGGWFGGRGGQPVVQRKLQKSSEWDSMLLLVGGASLGVLLIIGGFLYFSLTRGAAEDMFGAAETAYGNESYAQAIKLYDKYLEVHPKHEKAGLARVKREVARLRQVFKNPDQGLPVAEEVLPVIENEEDFPQVRDELASMLPQIARGFVDRALLTADSAAKGALLVQTAGAMKLVNNPVYIPTTLRKSQQTTIAAIEEDVERVQREIDREKDLVETVNAINASVLSGDTQLAYEARESLLSKYPGLDINESLHEAVLKISEKQRERVRIVNDPLQAMTDDPVTPVGPTVVLSHRIGQAVGGVVDYVVYVLSGGSVFALDASTGDLLWRRFVGLETTSYPQPLSTSVALSDAIAVDQRSQEVLRLEAKTGKLIWRLPIGEPFADPVIKEDRVYIAARSGKLHVVDAATGTAASHVLIPQPLETGPGVTDRRPCFYQLGDQDNLYVISRETFECQEVFYIGHKRGTIAVPPVMALGYLFVVENAGPDFCHLHIIATDQEGLNLKYAQKTERLQGQVLVPPVAGRRQVLVVTDLRAVELYDIDPNNANTTPVTSAGRNNATAEAPITSYSLLTNGYMWIANNRFTKYQVQDSTGKLPSEWVQDEQDVYVGPLQLIQDVIVHVRRRQAAPGFTVAATRLNDKDPSWQTELAAPPRGISVQGEVIEAVTSRGRLFEVKPADLSQGKVTQAKASATRDDRLILALTDAFDMGNGQWGFAPRSGYNQIVFYRPEGENAGLRLLTLTVPLGDAAIEPTPFDGGLLVPLRDGRIALSDITTGADKAAPFHPEIEAGTDTSWTGAAVLDAGKEFVIASDRQRMFRVGINETPQAHLQELSALALSERVLGPLAALQQVCYGATRTEAGDTLVSFELPVLKELQKSPLKGRVQWGPQRVGDAVLLATDTELMCWDGQPAPRWNVALEHSPIVGRPVVVDSHILLATDDGMLLRIDSQNGQTVAAVHVGEPLTWGPVPYQDGWLVAGKCGVLILVSGVSP